ncbi:hypothetical protein [Anabaena sp. UHCC 0204]|uniref:hypothetical protein n=1 Tax=Anabaena sp. UHCC 0204 TaxID=2590009 RepID=UPI0014466139|nr:hypothetical protein [Anabaena sp. UHCC 0204]MTJ06241.1 hypothetical protein [Anabaena sp. UHCC 0204]
MSINLAAETLIPLSIKQRKELILYHASLIDSTHIIDEDLHIAYQYGKTISSIGLEYFEYQIQKDNQNYSVLELETQSNLISNKTEQFADQFIDWLRTDFKNKSAILEHHPNPRNLFELCGAKLLVTSNSVTRSLSTKMGQLWEEIADISPYVIVPEFEFGIKIKGIDIVLLTDSKIKFAQLKTLKGTLTGSQTNRAKKELGIHDNPLFISAFNLGSWTFNDSKIPRIAGKEFWDMIHLEYELIENHIRYMLQRIDNEFAELAAK